MATLRACQLHTGGRRRYWGNRAVPGAANHTEQAGPWCHQLARCTAGGIEIKAAGAVEAHGWSIRKVHVAFACYPTPVAAASPAWAYPRCRRVLVFSTVAMVRRSMTLE